MIRFINKDGNGFSTELVNAETGEDILKIISVSYGAKINLDHDLVSASCNLMMCEVDTVAGKTEFLTKHPISGEFLPVAAIEFRDGVRVVFAKDGTPSVSAPPESEDAA